MNLRQVFGASPRLYFDTAPLIYYVEDHDHYAPQVESILKFMQESVPALEGFCSVVTLAEVLPVPLRAKNMELAAQYRDILLFSREITCLDLTAFIAQTAAELRAKYALKTPDALHLGTALAARCDHFLSNDYRLKRILEIKVIILDELSSIPLSDDDHPIG
jgi:predicted nucleic acid-binding protein